jgi:hypothetical protein
VKAVQRHSIGRLYGRAGDFRRINRVYRTRIGRVRDTVFRNVSTPAGRALDFISSYPYRCSAARILTPNITFDVLQPMSTVRPGQDVSDPAGRSSACQEGSARSSCVIPPPGGTSDRDPRVVVRWFGV